MKKGNVSYVSYISNMDKRESKIISLPTSSCNTCNQRNQRNHKFKTKGNYIIWIEKEKDGCTVYSTDSIFWRDFFNGV